MSSKTLIEPSRTVRLSQPSRPHAVVLDIERSGVLMGKTQTLLPQSNGGLREQAATFSPNELFAWLSSGDQGQRDAAFACLLERGPAAFAHLLAWFPAPLLGARRDMVTAGRPLEEHGPVVWLVALQLRTIAPDLRPLLQNPNSDHRFYALQLLYRVHDEPSLRDASVLLFDPDEQIRDTARRFVDLFRSQPSFQGVLQTVRRGLAHQEERIQAMAIEYSSEFNDIAGLNTVIGLLESPVSSIAQRAANALVRLTFQDFGTDRRAWDRWHKRVMGTRRDRWLLDAMIDRDRNVRVLASNAINRIPRIVLNYTPDMDRGGQLSAQRTLERLLRDRPGLV
jgi:hypothetical protein